MRERANRDPSVCLAPSLGSVTDTLKYNSDCVYVKDMGITITRCISYTELELQDGVHSTLAYRYLKKWYTLHTGMAFSHDRVQFAELLKGVLYKQDGVYFTYRGTNISKQSQFGARGINISNQA